MLINLINTLTLKWNNDKTCLLNYLKVWRYKIFQGHCFEELDCMDFLCINGINYDL